MEELSDELGKKVALNALSSSCLFHLRAFCFLTKLLSVSVIMFLSLVSNTNQYQTGELI